MLRQSAESAESEESAESVKSATSEEKATYHILSVFANSRLLLDVKFGFKNLNCVRKYILQL